MFLQRRGDRLKSAVPLKNCLHQNPRDLTLKYCEKTGVGESAYNASSSGWDRRILFEASLGYMWPCSKSPLHHLIPQNKLAILPQFSWCWNSRCVSHADWMWNALASHMWVKIWVSLEYFSPAYPMALASGHVPTSCLMPHSWGSLHRSNKSFTDLCYSCVQAGLRQFACLS